MPNSWKPVVQTDDTGKWYENALRFRTKDEAVQSALDLAMRWMAVNEWDAHPSDDAPTHTYINGRLESLPVTIPLSSLQVSYEDDMRDPGKRIKGDEV